VIDPKDFPTRFEFNRTRFDMIHKGDWRLPFIPPPVRIKILMVTDGTVGGFVNVTYGRLYFSLSEVVHTLQNNPEPWVKFDVTKAHRQSDPLGEADIDNFRFTTPGFDLDAYDQVWFFGARTGENEAQRLADDELAIVARWMDERQGGVFATGDHADFGASLCSKIPRVRAMRRWTPAQGAPLPQGADRHDTLLPGHDTTFTFNDESDDIPMPISPKMFALPSTLAFVQRESPHPLLCGTEGVIDVLPDHPHEGEVIEPLSLTNTFTFPGYANKPEFPIKLDGSGHRERAHVVATAQVRARSTAQDTNKFVCHGKTIGVVGAYNGHASGVGRVAVDSTWHHWFDINLVGRPLGAGQDPIDPVTSTDPKSQGFLYSTAGKAHYAKIKNYFRNTALWLSAPARQDQLFFRAAWRITMLYPLVEQLSVKLPLWELGGYALDAIGRASGPCTVRTWLFDRFAPVWREKFFIPAPEPCLCCPPIDALERMLVGGLVRELLIVADKAKDHPKGVAEADAVDAAIRGLELGAKEFNQMLEKSAKNTVAMARELQAVSPLKISPKQFVLGQAKVAKPRNRKSSKASATTSRKARRK
jgi:hypothetical protein